ncbi:multicomponent Na+:H+ antiporter subunit A [Arcanobacterium wilhelmae]|uniref:Multicomponent Na+:H+ antiporter subunit A n=1 Tax=Arcanobacterium wilhelmae TaxID=1803177 RepID=A0ABT9NBE4_9ACTO|nr:Na+/H+ antiporter subunit A [Arcanobacterium wilhelmae]MDP9800731.1 multicomponent Na+:H+ antiporter subunit A [Arcanobacterium wilhelmae]WFN90130.1 Na+/H+ antiporter subunit A [Arcanobacterium wilhelmae]
MLFILALFALAALLAPLVMRRGRLGFVALAAVPALAFGYVATRGPEVFAAARGIIDPAKLAPWPHALADVGAHGASNAQATAAVGGAPANVFPVENWAWAPQVHLELTFQLDVLSWVMALIVTGVGTLVLVYSTRYFSSSAAGLGRFAAVFTGFAGAMLGLVTTDNTLALYMFWELTTVFSFLLIGHSFSKPASRRAAMQALTVTTTGGLAMLAGIVILGQVPGGSYRLSELVAAAQAGTLGQAALAVESASPALIATAVALVLAGAVSKSALVPFHFWLPAAMAAPTPVSAYLHSSAMVKAGVYLVARLAPGFSELAVWQWIVVPLGIYTLMLGGYRALKQYDLKLVLAFGTVSQLGLITLMVGYGTAAMMLAGLAMLVAHSLFKAALFLSVGQVDWATGTRDLRKLFGVGSAMWPTAGAAALAGASMAGLPGFAGFVAKEGALTALVGGGALDTVTWAAIAAGSALTVAYTLRYWFGAFTSWGYVPDAGVSDVAEPATPYDPPAGETPVRETHAIMTAPILVLAGASLAFGLAGSVLDRVLAPHALAGFAPGGFAGYALTHGGIVGENVPHLTPAIHFGWPLAISAAVWAAGALIFAGTALIEKVTRRLEFPLSASGAYANTIRGLENASGVTTALTQRGSLPAYIATMMVFILVAASGALLIIGPGHWPELRAWDSPAQAVVVAITALAAILGARARHRMKAVLLLGIAGYGVALVYELYGAPDLALTQVLVETMSLVVFVLVLRRLPAYFSNRPLALTRWWRIGLGAAAGLAVAVIGALAAGARVATPIARDFHDLAYSHGYGKNIVNVTLVDIRAWDTMGELTVLVACAIGISSLLFIRDRVGRVDRLRNVAIPVDVRERAGFRREADFGDAGARARDGDAGGSVRGASAGGATGRLFWGNRGLQESPAHAADSGAAAAPARSSDTNRAPASAAATTSGAVPTSGGRARLWLVGTEALREGSRSVILEIGTRVIYHAILVVSVFFLFSGHNQPGGGFAGGLLAGIALTIRYLAAGRYELGAAVPLHPGHLMGSGLVIAGAAALAPLALGGTILQTAKLDFVLPAFGHVHLATAIFFDIGVYLVVVGLILDVLRSLGAEIDRHGELEGIGDDDAVRLTPAADSRLERFDAATAAGAEGTSESSVLGGHKILGGKIGARPNIEADPRKNEPIFYVGEVSGEQSPEGPAGAAKEGGAR